MLLDSYGLKMLYPQRISANMYCPKGGVDTLRTVTIN